jgi:hypothetical protein
MDYDYSKTFENVADFAEDLKKGIPFYYHRDEDNYEINPTLFVISNGMLDWDGENASLSFNETYSVQNLIATMMAVISLFD